MQHHPVPPDVFAPGLIPGIPRLRSGRRLRRNPLFTYLAFVGISLVLLGSIAIGSLGT